MGAPKQKWIAEEEAALKAGVLKHGSGKWRTILSDPEFSSILHSRSNVDLKDKWRNINVTSVWGSRKKAKNALNKVPSTPKLDDSNPIALNIVPSNDQETAGAKLNAISNEPVQSDCSRKLAPSLDNLILDAITSLKEPRGSDRVSVFRYIEDKYGTTPNLKRLVATKLEHLIRNGTLIKIKHRYRIVQNTPNSGARKRSPQLLFEGNQMNSSKSEKIEIRIHSKSEVDRELSKIRGMTAQEAAAAAAQAIAEAEVAIAEAEVAAREAEKAEAEAEAAHIFAEAAMKALKYRILHVW